MPKSIASRIKLLSGSNYMKQRFDQWAKRRIPLSPRLTLGQRQIFILPTSQGVLFSVVVLLMLIASINYENSLAFVITFILASFFVISILHTYKNLEGLTLEGGTAHGIFLGEEAHLPIVVSRLSNRSYEALEFAAENEWMAVLDLIEPERETAYIRIRPKQRGWAELGRFRLETRFPSGLIKAWSWPHLKLGCLVYPKPKVCELPANCGSSPEGQHQSQLFNTEDFEGLSDYRLGDNMRHVAWKIYARNDQLMVKEFNSTAKQEFWLDFNAFSAGDDETRLSCLCYWALLFSREDHPFGLKLPQQTIAIGQGSEHRDQVLRALALFQR